MGVKKNPRIRMNKSRHGPEPDERVGGHDTAVLLSRGPKDLLGIGHCSQGRRCPEEPKALGICPW